MKKVLLLLSVISLPLMVQAYPGMDMTEGGAPFLLLQQNAFEKTEFNDYKNFKDANDKPASMRTDSAQTLKDEYKIKEKRHRFRFRSINDQTQDTKTQEMKIIEKDGQIMIKQIGY